MRPIERRRTERFDLGIVESTLGEFALFLCPGYLPMPRLLGRGILSFQRPPSQRAFCQCVIRCGGRLKEANNASQKPRCT